MVSHLAFFLCFIILKPLFFFPLSLSLHSEAFFKELCSVPGDGISRLYLALHTVRFSLHTWSSFPCIESYSNLFLLPDRQANYFSCSSLCTVFSTLFRKIYLGFFGVIAFFPFSVFFLFMSACCHNHLFKK